MATFEGQQVYLSRKWLPAEQFVALQDVLKDNGARVFVCSDPSCNASTDFHVLASFDTDKFDELESKGCNVVGPECVFRCAKERRPLPSRKFTRCICMDGVGILATGFSPKEKEKIQHLVTGMCGQILDDPSQINFVISKNVLSAKYKHAQKWRKPILTLDWLHQCWKEHRLVSAEPYKLPPFAGLNICLTNISSSEIRNDIEIKTVANGGQFSKNLTKDCTHLIANSAGGDKYKVAKIWGTISLINEQWFWKSIEAKVCLDESLFPVGARAADQPNQRNVQEHALETPAARAPSSLILETEKGKLLAHQNTAASQHETISCVTISENQSHAPAVLDLPTEDNADNSYEGEGLYLSACRVHLMGFASSEEKKLVSLLREGGASRFIEMNETVTHVIVGQPAESEVKDIRQLMMWGAIHVVLPTWLFECTRCRDEVSVKAHLASAKLFLQGNQGRISQRLSSTMGASLPDAKQAMPGVVAGSAPKQGPSNSIPHDHSKLVCTTEKFDTPLTHFPGGECVVADVVSCLEDSFANVSEKAHLSEGMKKSMQPSKTGAMVSVTVPATQIEGKSKGCSDSVFAGYSFGLLDPTPSQQASEVMNVIIHGGGTLEQDISLKRLNFVVFFHESQHGPPVYHGSAKLVSDIWIRHCAEDGKVLSLQAHVLYEPLLNRTPLFGFEKFVLCPSQLTNRERELMSKLCSLLGCKFTEDLTRQNTHLICKSPNGRKYEGAVVLGKIATISQDWLTACVLKNKVVPLDDYCIGNKAHSEDRNRISSVTTMEGAPDSSVPVRRMLDAPLKDPVEKDEKTNTLRGPETDARAQAAGKKDGTRGNQAHQSKTRSKVPEIRLSQVQKHDDELDPWDVLTAPWASEGSRKKKKKAYPETVKAGTLPRAATKFQRSPNVAAAEPDRLTTEIQDQDDGKSVDVAIHHGDSSPSLKQNGDKVDAVEAGGSEALKDSKDGQFSEDVAAAIEVLLKQTSKAINNVATKTNLDPLLLSPERTSLRRRNRDDSSSQSEFKRSKPSWHRSRSVTGDQNVLSNAQKQVTNDRFEDTQMDSQVVRYEEDHAGRQLIMEKVRTRSSTKTAGSVIRTEKSKEAWKERLCRVADGNK